MDVLQEHLTRARAVGGVFARSIAEPPWGLALPADIQLTVHAVVQGRVWLWTADGAPAIELGPGDLAVVRGGAEHFVAHRAGADCVSHEEFWARPTETTVTADRAVFLCGAYRFAGDIGKGLIEGLPRVFRVPASVEDPVNAIVTLLSREMLHDAPGKQTVLDRLLDVLVVLALRHGFAHSDDAPAWFAAASDPRLGPVLHAMHASPDHPWTVDELAHLGNMSRATFARSFQKALDQAPMHYLTDWRMALARDLLADRDLVLDEVARRVGYSSGYSFATAFRRLHGETPGRWRTRVETIA